MPTKKKAKKSKKAKKEQILMAHLPAAELHTTLKEKEHLEYLLIKVCEQVGICNYRSQGVLAMDRLMLRARRGELDNELLSELTLRMAAKEDAGIWESLVLAWLGRARCLGLTGRTVKPGTLETRLHAMEVLESVLTGCREHKEDAAKQRKRVKELEHTILALQRMAVKE